MARPLTKTLCLLMVLSVSWAERSQGWVSLILRDYHFILPGNTYTGYFLSPGFKSRSPCQYVIMSPVTYIHSLFINFVVTMSWPETAACLLLISLPTSLNFPFMSPYSYALCLTVVAPCTPSLGKQYGNSCLRPVEQMRPSEASCFPGVSPVHAAPSWIGRRTEFIVSRGIHSCGSGSSIINLCLWISLPPPSCLTVIWKNWTKSSPLTNSKWSCCACWESVGQRGN